MITTEMVEELRAEAQMATVTISDQNKVIEELIRNVTSLELNANLLEDKLEQKDAQIAQLTAKTARLTAEIARLNDRSSPNCTWPSSTTQVTIASTTLTNTIDASTTTTTTTTAIAQATSTNDTTFTSATLATTPASTQSRLQNSSKLFIKCDKFFIASTKATGAAKKQTVLVLSTYGVNKAPLLVDAKGQNDRNIIMSFGEDTEVYKSCSVTYRNRFHIFGGDSEKRQISEVTKCELKRIGTLDFDHEYGACSNVDDQKIYLCFDEKDKKECRSAVDPLGVFTEVERSSYDHRKIRTAASPSNHQVFGHFQFSYF